MNDMNSNNPENGNILIYQSEDGLTHIDVRMEQETVWLTQQQLCELYQTSKSNISEHIKHIFKDGELKEILVVRNPNNHSTQSDLSEIPTGSTTPYLP